MTDPRSVATPPSGHEVIGRAGEMEAVERFLSDMTDGPAILVLNGEAGIGKTTLWQQAIDAAGARGYPLLIARPTGTEASLTYAALGDLFRGVGDDVTAGLPAPQRSALDAALLRVTSTAPVDQRAVSVAFSAVLARIAGDVPLLVAVDDAHWLDVGSRRVLEFAIRRLGDARVGCLLSVRSSEPTPLVDAARSAVPEGRANQLDIGPLSLGALHRLFISRLGRSFSRPTLVRLERESGGNPLIALEIGRALLESGHDPVPGEALPVPTGVRQLLGRRLGRLPPRTRAALLILAAESRPTMERLGAASAADPEEALGPAERAGIIERFEGRLRFAHPLFASVVYGDAPAAERRAVHSTLAELTLDEEDRARHLALAATGRDEEVAGALETAAGQARLRGAPDAAAALYRQAIALTPSEEQEAAGRRVVAFGETLLEAGDLAGVRTFLEDAIPSLERGAARANARTLLATVQWYSGDPAAASTAEAALEDAAGHRTLQGRIHTRLALIRDDDRVEGARHSRAAIELIDPEDDPGLFAFALFALFYDEVALGMPPRLDLLDRALALEPKGGTWEVSSIPGLWWKYTDDYPAARARLELGIRWARETGDESSDADLLAHLSELELWAGDWVLAERYAEQSVEAAEQMGQAAPNSADRMRALVWAHLGRTAEAREAAEEGRRASDDDPLMSAMYRTVLGFAALTDAAPELADRHFTELHAMTDRMGMREPLRFRSEPDHIEALLSLGELDRAEEVLERLRQRHRQLPRPWTAVTVPRSNALLLAARGNLVEAEAEIDRAFTGHAQLHSPFELARTRLVQGQLLRRMDRRRAAAEVLTQARQSFDQLGATAWSQRAAAEVARLALRRRAGPELTPTEQQVAELAAQGLRNREVAERLFISPKTVEANLARAYGKLGIRSRAELGRRMAVDGPHADEDPTET